MPSPGLPAEHLPPAAFPLCGDLARHQLLCVAIVQCEIRGDDRHFGTDRIPAQRQYESRSTFRNLALSAGASEFHLNLITHPKPKRASDFYTRLEMQWPGMCAAVLAIDSAAWEGTTAAVTQGEVTFRVTGKGTTNEKPPTSLEIVGGKMEREKGFEAYRG